MTFEELAIHPNGIYVVKTNNAEEVSRTAMDLMERLRIGPCTFIYIQPDESIECLTDERLRELGLQRISIPEKREINMAQFRANFERAKHYLRETSPQVVTQIEQAFDLKLEGESWACDNHREPITYTDGRTECYCGNKR